MLDALGLCFNPQQVVSILKTVDTDCNGSIQFQEFKEWYSAPGTKL